MAIPSIRALDLTSFYCAPILELTLLFNCLSNKLIRVGE